MQSVRSQIHKVASYVSKRNFGVTAPILQKSDPIQQLFVDKIRDYKKKSSGGKLVEPSPSLERELKADLDKAMKQYGGGPKVDMCKFPNIDFPEATLDPINLEVK